MDQKPGFGSAWQEYILDKKAPDAHFDQCLQAYRITKMPVPGDAKNWPFGLKCPHEHAWSRRTGVAEIWMGRNIRVFIFLPSPSFCHIAIGWSRVDGSLCDRLFARVFCALSTLSRVVRTGRERDGPRKSVFVHFGRQFLRDLSWRGCGTIMRGGQAGLAALSRPSHRPLNKREWPISPWPWRRWRFRAVPW